MMLVWHTSPVNPVGQVQWKALMVVCPAFGPVTTLSVVSYCNELVTAATLCACGSAGCEMTKRLFATRYSSSARTLELPGTAPRATACTQNCARAGSAVARVTCQVEAVPGIVRRALRTACVSGCADDERYGCSAAAAALSVALSKQRENCVCVVHRPRTHGSVGEHAVTGRVTGEGTVVSGGVWVLPVPVPGAAVDVDVDVASALRMVSGWEARTVPLLRCRRMGDVAEGTCAGEARSTVLMRTLMLVWMMATCEMSN